ncbi:hypothetical protein Tco_0802016 [Tanacetum coccineum]|uniref:Uncharacterized protein n=1 Tax=Tanacetum coccineum TaxID=301880 RepID=A0ABQ5A1W5_9ASTR
MNPQETQQVAARDEKWIPSADRVKINSTNMRLETTVPQKEETFQVMIDVIKNSTCFKAFTIFVDVPEIFMQQFWQSKRSKILDICPRVEGEEFTELQNDDDTLTFLLDLGYKGPLHKYTNMIDIMWGMFYKENVDYPVLIWEDFAYQIDHKKERRSRREDYQEYGLEIPNVMLNDTIKRSESYQMFIKYSTGQIPPKKSRGKGSQDVALELGKSISLTEAEEAKAARKVHATHARIVTESAKKKSGGRSSRGVAIQDTLSAPKPKPATSKPKLKGTQSLTHAKKEAADIMQALKESKKTSKRQPGTGGSSEGTGTILGVPDESTVVSATSSEGTGTKPGVPDEEKDITKENVILEWGSEQESKYSEEDQLDDEEKDDKEGDADDEGDDHISDTQDTDDEDDETESDEDDIYKYKIRDKEDTDAAKEDVEKTEETKDDSKKAELPPTSSSLSISSGFGDQFLKLSSDTSLVGTTKDNTDAEINSLLDIKIQSEVPHI